MASAGDAAQANQPKNEKESQTSTEDDDDPDEWDKRIIKTGCSEENAKLTDCYWEKKDWRACKDEMKQFQDCWKQKGNADRTETRNAS